MRISRVGESGYNTYGTPMKIIRYYLSGDITIEFQDEHKVQVNTTYSNFTIGKIKNPYDRTSANVGYIGEGKYKTKSGRLFEPQYKAWRNMIMRCYDEKERDMHKSYYNCEVCEEWHNLQNFGKWYDENYYDLNEGRMHLDKDILHKGNKIYSPDNCLFMPQRINMLFVTRKSERGDFPCGVHQTDSGTYNVICGIDTGIVENLGTFKNVDKAFNAYKIRKEQNIKEVANKYKGRIPNKLYNALYDWKVEITD